MSDAAASQAPWLIYGANGYTGRLIAEEAARRGLRPILAGRSREPIMRLAAEIGLEHRLFALDQADDAAQGLEEARLVLNCAGPFSQTARAMIEACFVSGAHYLDITGEINVLENAASFGERANENGIVLLPAVGFDVVPTDCLAAALAEKLPSAKRLLLAFGGLSRLSPGTSKTILEMLPQGGMARIDGAIRPVPVAWKVRKIPFADGRKWAMTIPWGDVSTAWHSTGIPNIEVYTATPRRQIGWMKRLSPLRHVMKASFMQRAAARIIEWRVTGPDAERRQRDQAQIWGRVEDEAGSAWEATMQTPEGYAFTVVSALACVERMLSTPPLPGFYTPSKAFGWRLAPSLPGVVFDEPHPAKPSGPENDS